MRLFFCACCSRCLSHRCFSARGEVLLSKRCSLAPTDRVAGGGPFCSIFSRFNAAARASAIFASHVHRADLASSRKDSVDAMLPP